ncbi:hypothetical protein CASFOL_015518 [Castilleja foliolosa]|uniref:Two-component response regulator-like APRR1 n=1 Tax=Castilleja foliolosa TaxID=1961234 RepID=A0ABD3DDY5_9LAMI
MEKSEMGKNGDGFIDRSKVRILLCDNDEKSSKEVFTLLCKCSYQVTSVKSPRQVIDALNAEGPDIDIILSEVDLPMAKGMKMLKYIMRDKELRRIPVIMMSGKDEVAIVVKCLKLGAADYLVKPLRTNELLNLWTHMWRRRRMLGLAEKNIINYDLDLVVSDPSDANTNSTTLLSDDTDDKSRKSINLETCVSTHHENQTNANATTTAASIQTACEALSDYQPDVPGLIDRQHRGPTSPFQKKKDLKIGESSAFFTYVKSTTLQGNSHVSPTFHENPPKHQNTIQDNPSLMSCQVNTTDTRGQQSNKITTETHYQANDHPVTNSIIPNSFSNEQSSTPPISVDSSQRTQTRQSNEEFSQAYFHSRNGSPNSAIGCYQHSAYPYYMPGLMNQVPIQLAPANMNHANPTIMPQYNHIPQPHVPGMGSYPYYPFGICLQPGQQMPTPPHHQWPSFGNLSNEGNMGKVDRREAALMKFRQKRKERCFDKKIRYVNRKKLAERRPRLRGQFVRKVNGVNVDLNGQPAEGDEEEEDYYEDDQSNMDYSVEDDGSECQR